MAVSSYLAFATAFAIVVASPGPGLAAILSRSLSSGPRAGLLVVCGLAIIDVLFLGIAVAGLSAISVLLGPWFQFAKYVAAAYLIYIGIRLFLATGDGGEPLDSGTDRSWWRDVYLGCLVTLGNPKAIMFFAALLPAVFDIAEVDVGAYLFLCVLMTAVTFAIYSIYIYVAQFAAQKARSTRLVSRVSGTAMIGAGALVAIRD